VAKVSGSEGILTNAERPLLKQEGCPRLKGADGVVAYAIPIGKLSIELGGGLCERPPRRFAPPLLCQDGTS